MSHSGFVSDEIYFVFLSKYIRFKDLLYHFRSCTKPEIERTKRVLRFKAHVFNLGNIFLAMPLNFHRKTTYSTNGISSSASRNLIEQQGRKS
jgi:hypothetical protein